MGKVKNTLSKRLENAKRLEKEAPNLYNGFSELMKHYYKPGVLELKYKELMTVALSVAIRCEPCLAFHVNAAIAAGAIREEIIEAAAIGIEFGGGPAFAFVRDNLLDFIDEILEDQSSSEKNE
ncbi:MAG: carboxymuconolactone decarboxylase family protein [Deltaproteobacteria bacterium]|nr:carboxymuconolactone decarboxylase family protein [Deltaproteobacteria bacterium]